MDSGSSPQIAVEVPQEDEVCECGMKLTIDNVIAQRTCKKTGVMHTPTHPSKNLDIDKDAFLRIAEFSEWFAEIDEPNRIKIVNEKYAQFCDEMSWRRPEDNFGLALFCYMTTDQRKTYFVKFAPFVEGDPKTSALIESVPSTVFSELARAPLTFDALRRDVKKKLTFMQSQEWKAHSLKNCVQRRGSNSSDRRGSGGSSDGGLSEGRTKSKSFLERFGVRRSSNSSNRSLTPEPQQESDSTPDPKPE